MLGNRNWTIHIDCGPDAVVVVPTGRRLSTGTMYAGGDSYGQLYEEVRQLIARRQATVRPGEPPYRVQVRFQVRPDGVRAYYLAYPALERLGVPMTRENLDRDEDAKPRPLAR